MATKGPLTPHNKQHSAFSLKGTSKGIGVRTLGACHLQHSPRVASCSALCVRLGACSPWNMTNPSAAEAKTCTEQSLVAKVTGNCRSPVRDVRNKPLQHGHTLQRQVGNIHRGRTFLQRFAGNRSSTHWSGNQKWNYVTDVSLSQYGEIWQYKGTWKSDIQSCHFCYLINLASKQLSSTARDGCSVQIHSAIYWHMKKIFGFKVKDKKLLTNKSRGYCYLIPPT